MWISFWPATYMLWNETILQQSLWFYGTCIFRCMFSYLFCLKEEVLVFFHLEKRAGKIIHFHCFMHIQVSTAFPLCLSVTFCFLWVTRGDRNSNLQVAVTHDWHVCSQHTLGLPLKMNGIHRTQSDHALLDLILLTVWSDMF